MPRPRPMPAVVLAGVDRFHMEVVEGSVLVSLREPVLLRYEIDMQEGVLTRHVSDRSGVVERQVVGLDHACLSCALRFEIVPTLVRLAESGRWESVAVSLPVAAEPAPLVRGVRQMVVDGRPAADRVDVRSVVACLSGSGFHADLFGDDLLCERDATRHDGDRRAVGEVLAQQLEYADVQAVAAGVLDATALAVVRELCRPDSRRIQDAAEISHDVVVGSPRDEAAADAWIEPTERVPVAPAVSRGDEAYDATADHASDVWTVHLDSWRPFHPERLMANLAAIGGNGYRGRGCFWLPSRPHAIAAWDGAGGQLSVGSVGSWSGRQPRTRIVVTGVGPGRDDVIDALNDSLMTEREMVGAVRWVGRDDGFDPWLGQYSETA